MDNDQINTFSWAELECNNYRTLQRVAKSMNLPSNVKKVYLIQMIRAKKFMSEVELNSIIQKVKSERQQLLQVRKKRNRKKSHLQGSEVSSTSNSHSPPISQTPKRPGNIARTTICSPDFQQAFMNFKSKQNLLYSDTNKTYSSPRTSNRSDRVLRSCNVKTVKKPYYDLTEETVCSSIQSESKPVYSVVNTKKPEFSTVWGNTNPIVRVTRAESNVAYNTVRADTKPMFKAVTSESRPIIRTQNSLNRQEIVNKQVCPKPEIPRNIIVKKYRPAILSSSTNLPVRKSISNQDVNNQVIRFEKISSPKQSNPMPFIVNTMSGVPAKRQRIVSGVYPLLPTEPPPKIRYEMIESVGFRHKDGKISKINALVQKSAVKRKICDVLPPGDRIEVTVEDLINCNIDINSSNQPDYAMTEANITSQNMNITNHNEYATMPCLSDVAYGQNVFNDVNSDQRNIADTYKENNDSQYSVYYHKKIRGEQVRTHRGHRELPKEERLPKINAVFSRFHDVNNSIMQPIYVQVSEESERIQPNPIYAAANTTNTNLLENLYNFRSQFIVNQPLLQIVTTSNTHCVYSTPTITTALLACCTAFRVPQQASSAVSSAYISSTCEQDDQLHNAEMNPLPGISDLLKIAEQDYTKEDHNEELSSCSSLERSVCQNLGANVTIPEMEDALELISQDGDYMERIGMDVRMQCVLCSWAGPRFMLESHIRKEHPNQIFKENKSQWTITFTLGSLVQAKHWACRILEHDALYVLSVKHDSADYLMATLSTLETETDLPKTGSITIYNKVTGEPYFWEGDIQCISPNMPYDNNVDCLKLELSRLDLLPNSANLKLLHGELVLKSPTKVVVGQPELDDIHVILFVKIFN